MSLYDMKSVFNMKHAVAARRRSDNIIVDNHASFRYLSLRRGNHAGSNARVPLAISADRRRAGFDQVRACHFSAINKSCQDTSFTPATSSLYHSARGLACVI